MASWIDVIQESERAKSSSTDDVPVLEDELDPIEESSVPDLRRSSEWKLYAVASAFLVVLVVLTAVVFFGSGDSISAGTADEAETSQQAALLEEPVVSTPGVLVIGNCEHAGEVPEDFASLVDVVASFEYAYFGRDVDGIEATLTDDAALLGTDWASITAEAAPVGTDWCGVVMQTSREDRVSVMLDVNPPSGPAMIFQSVVEGTKNVDGSWLIAQFIDPSVPAEDEDASSQSA